MFDWQTLTADTVLRLFHEHDVEPDYTVWLKPVGERFHGCAIGVIGMHCGMGFAELLRLPYDWDEFIERTGLPLDFVRGIAIGFDSCLLRIEDMGAADLSDLPRIKKCLLDSHLRLVRRAQNAAGISLGVDVAVACFTAQRARLGQSENSAAEPAYV